MNTRISGVRLHKARKIAVTDDISVSYFFPSGTEDFLLLLIHGLGSAKEDFLPVLKFPDLAANRILFPDLVGHGDSSKPASYSYSMDDQADILMQLIGALNIKSQIVVIAHSMGGPVAVSLAERLGNRIMGIIYAEGNIDAGDCFFSKKIISTFSITKWEESGFDQFLKRFQDNPKTADYAATLSKAGPFSIYRSSEDLCRVSEEDTLFMRLVNLSIPVLGIFGDKNKGKFSSEEKLLSKFPVRYIPNAGHSMMIDNTASFYQAIADFLKQF
jgi:pimeloyl-ACP methyl ester carboxylesterase